MTWVASLIGKPYAADGQGPDAFNCWALVRHALQIGHGLEVPVLAMDTEEGWRAIGLRAKMAREWAVTAGRARAGDILSMVGARRDLHVGLCLDSVRVLHTSADSGEARVQRQQELRFLGFDRFEVWRHQCST